MLITPVSADLLFLCSSVSVMWLVNGVGIPHCQEFSPFRLQIVWRHCGLSGEKAHWERWNLMYFLFNARSTMALYFNPYWMHFCYPIRLPWVSVSNGGCHNHSLSPIALYALYRLWPEDRSNGTQLVMSHWGEMASSSPITFYSYTLQFSLLAETFTQGNLQKWPPCKCLVGAHLAPTGYQVGEASPSNWCKAVLNYIELIGVSHWLLNEGIRRAGSLQL